MERPDSVFRNQYKVWKLPENLKILERNCEEYIKDENIEEIQEIILTINQLQNLNIKEKKIFQVLSVKMIQILMKKKDKELMLDLFLAFEKQKNIPGLYCFFEFFSDNLIDCEFLYERAKSIGYPFRSRIYRLLVEIFCLKNEKIISEIFNDMKQKQGVEFLISTYFSKLSKLTNDPKLIFEKYEMFYDFGLNHTSQSFHIVLKSLISLDDVESSNLILNDNRRSFVNDSVTYNTILSIYLEKGFERERVSNLVDEIYFHGIQITKELFTTLLKYYQFHGKKNDSLSLLKHISNYDLDTTLYTSIVNVASKYSIEEGLEIIERSKDQNLNSISHYNTILNNCILYFPKNINLVINKIVEDKMEINEFTLSILLKLSKDKNQRLFIEGLIEMIQKKVEYPNLKLMTNILKYYLYSNNSKKLKETFDFLLDNQKVYQLDNHVFLIMLSSYSNTIKDIAEIFEKMIKLKIKPNRLVYNFLNETYKKTNSNEIKVILLKYFPK
eukprot:gene10362-2891_t